MESFYDQELTRVEQLMPAFKQISAHSGFLIKFCNNKNSSYKTIKSHCRTINRPFIEETEEAFKLRNIEDVIETFLDNSKEYITAYEIAEKYRKGTALTQEEIDIISKNVDVCVFDVAKKVDEHLEPVINDIALCEHFANDSYKQIKIKLEYLYKDNPTGLVNQLGHKNCVSIFNSAVDILSEPVNNYNEAFTSTYSGYSFSEFAVVNYINKYSSIEDARFSKPKNPSPEESPIKKK